MEFAHPKETFLISICFKYQGPLGVNEYLGRGTFKLPGKTITVKHVGMMAGGTGITPMLQAR